MKALIDADILRYQIGSVQIRHPYLEKEFIPAPVEEIHNLVDDLIDEILRDTESDEFVCGFTGNGNFRFNIAKQAPYKGNRSSVEKPYHYNTVGDYIMRKYPSIVVVGAEADDWMGIEQRADMENTVICSRDKDLKTVMGWHYRFACGERQPKQMPHWISEYEARRFFFQQMLTGDNTDNILGCGKREEVMWGGKLQLRRKGIGEKTAIKLLEDCETVKDMFNVVEEEYKKRFNEDNESYEDIMLENARLLYIGQYEDDLFSWDWINYEVNKESNNDQTIRNDTYGNKRILPDESKPNYESGSCSESNTGICTPIPCFG